MLACDFESALTYELQRSMCSWGTKHVKVKGIREFPAEHLDLSAVVALKANFSSPFDGRR